MNDRFLRINEITEILGVSKSTIWSWLKQGKFVKPLKLSARVTVWKLSDINNFIEEITPRI